MARTVDPPADGGGSGMPGQSGYVPPTDSNAKISIVVSSSNATITADQIAVAGGPWASFEVRVTPINAQGAGTAAEVAYPPS